VEVPGIALQLYTLREAAAEDLPAVLGRIREMGWEYVQWSGMPDLPADSIRRHLDEAGLRCIAGHYSVEAFEEDFAGAAAFWKTIGAKDVAPGGMMEECRADIAAWKRGCQRLNVLGGRLREEGMRFSYHNHDFEFETFPADPRAKLDILYESTDPSHLYAELDTAWVRQGGADPADYIRRYAGRCPVIHVKDLAPAPAEDGGVDFTALGRGILDWASIFRETRNAGVEWYVYEQDRGAGDMFENCRISLAFLKERVPG
jgi:sugar phosphate isomerase/epimerase